MASKKYVITIDMDNPTQNTIDNATAYFSVLADEVADFKYENTDDGLESKVFKSILTFDSKEKLRLVFIELQNRGIVKKMELNDAALEFFREAPKTVHVTNNITNNYVKTVKNEILSAKKKVSNRKSILDRPLSEITVNQAIWAKIAHNWVEMFKRMSK